MNVQELARKHLKRRSPLSDLLSPLGKINSLIQTQRRQLLAGKGWHPPCQVVSVGNIVSGGSGKTPFTLHLAAMMQATGYRVGISHRGYLGRLENTPTLIADRGRILYGASDAGDEARLLAQRLPGIPVVVGKHRVAAVSLLLAEFPDLDLVILDDAFQHLGIARELDIVCFDTETGLGNGRLLPAGYLREPLSALEAASLLVVVEKQGCECPEAIAGDWERFHRPVLRCLLRAREGVDAEGRPVHLDALKGKRLLLISGIAAPDSFEATARALGLSWVHHFRWPDHYAFNDGQEVSRMAARAEKYRAELMLCTEKDLAKLARHEVLRNKLLALRMDLVCEDEVALRDLLRQKLDI